MADVNVPFSGARWGPCAARTGRPRHAAIGHRGLGHRCARKAAGQWEGAGTEHRTCAPDAVDQGLRGRTEQHHRRGRSGAVRRRPEGPSWRKTAVAADRWPSTSSVATQPATHHHRRRERSARRCSARDREHRLTALPGCSGSGRSRVRGRALSDASSKRPRRSGPELRGPRARTPPTAGWGSGESARQEVATQTQTRSVLAVVVVSSPGRGRTTRWSR
jgi:hypothetical protein